MKCPICKEFDNSVLETRKQSNVVWRRRYCESCSNTFVTSETVAPRFPVGVWNNTIQKKRLFHPKKGTK